MANDPDFTSLLAIGGGGMGVGGLLIGLLKWSTTRNLQAIDDRFVGLAKSMDTIGSEMKNLIGEVHRYNTQLAVLAKDVGYLTAEKDKLIGKIEGLQSFWVARFEKHIQQVHEDFERHRKSMHDFKNEMTRNILESYLGKKDAEKK